MSDMTFGDWFIAGLGLALGWVVIHALTFNLDRIYIAWRQRND